MSYNESTPASINESFSVSQPKIKANFESIKTAFDQDHVTFDSGKHKQLTMPEQAAASTTAVNEMAIYTLENAVTNVSNLYLRLESSGTQFNMTPSVLGLAASGYEVLPSGLIINWGSGTAGGTSGTNTSFTKAFAAAPYSVTVTEKVAAGIGHNFTTIVTGSVTTAGFSTKAFDGNNNAVSGISIFYIAIGK